jgi:hypothetical protein
MTKVGLITDHTPYGCAALRLSQTAQAEYHILIFWSNIFFIHFPLQTEILYHPISIGSLESLNSLV